MRSTYCGTLFALIAFTIGLTAVASANPSNAPASKNQCGHHLEVRVVDSRNVPIPGATVQFVWVTPPGGSFMMVGNDEVEKIEYKTLFEKQFADEQGMVLCQKCCDDEGSYEVVADSPSFATGTVQGLSPDSVVVLRLMTGATVRGRVMRGNEPVAGARVTMVGGLEVETDTNGSYEYTHLVPQSSYVFYTPMDHGKSAGATHSWYIVTEGSGTTTLAPDFQAGPVHTLRGVLVPPPGVKFPERILLYWSRTIKSQRGLDPWYERPYLRLAPSGEFEITGLPEQEIRLELEYPGWKFSRQAPTPFVRNSDGTWLTWTVHSDLEDVRIPLIFDPPKPGQSPSHGP